jgi:hypothetical protein
MQFEQVLCPCSLCLLEEVLLYKESQPLSDNKEVDQLSHLASLHGVHQRRVYSKLVIARSYHVLRLPS